MSKPATAKVIKNTKPAAEAAPEAAEATEAVAAAPATEKQAKLKKTFTLLQRNTEGGFNESELPVKTELLAINTIHKMITGSDLPLGTNTYNARKITSEVAKSEGAVSVILNLKEEDAEGKVKHYNIITF